MNPYFQNLKSLRSQKDAGLSFNFRGAVYTVIPKDGEMPRYIQPLRSKTDLENLVNALTEAKENGSIVIALWVGKYKTDMFLIDDIDLVLQQLLKD